MNEKDAYRKDLTEHYAMVMEDHRVGDMDLLNFLGEPMEVSGDHITMSLNIQASTENF